MHGPDSNRPRTAFIGTGAFGLDALRRLAVAEDVDLVAVVTAPPRPAGRGRRVARSPIDTAAREIGVETILTPARLRAPTAIADVLALVPALAVLADYGQLVPPALLDLSFGALNLHPSLLPRHRGASPIPATILFGDSRTGVTLMKMDEGLDTGPIVAVEELVLVGDETAPGLEATLAGVAAHLLMRTLGPWLRGEIVARPQAVEGGTLTRPLHREDGRLDPDRPAAVLARQVRAYQPWPGSWLETADGRLTVWRARSDDRPPRDVAGTLVRHGGRLGFVTVDGTLWIDEAQLPGGRRMPIADLLRGHALSKRA